MLSKLTIKATKGEGRPLDLAMWLQILNPKQMLQRLPIALAQVKPGTPSENLLNEITEIIYSLYRKKKSLKGVQQYNAFNKDITREQKLYLWVLKIVKHLILTGYYSILKIK